MLKAMTIMTTTLHRDISALTQRRLFWWALTIWAFITTLIFFAYLEDFLAIQPKLRAKNFRYGVTDLVIIPYIKTLGLVALIFIAALCSRLFYNEHFSPFSLLYRSTQPSASTLLLAKSTYIISISLTLIALLSLPPLISGFFFDYHLSRVIITLIAQFVLLFTVGMLAMTLSQILAYSVLVVLVCGAVVLLPMLLTRLFVEPAWLVAIVAFFSPIAHLNRITTGVIMLSDGVFFVTLWLLLGAISLRQFNNTYMKS